MKNKLLTLIPEFQTISDKSLQENTLKVWIEAVRMSGWDISELHEMPFTLLIKNCSINIIEHTRAVTRCCLKIADVMLEEYKEKISLNRDYLLSGALLHDVGKLFEYRKEGDKFIKSEEGKLLRHPISGAVFAGKFDIPLDVLHIIAAHSKEGDGARYTIESIIVNHADFVNFEALRTL